MELREIPSKLVYRLVERLFDAKLIFPLVSKKFYQFFKRICIIIARVNFLTAQIIALSRVPAIT